MLLQWGVFSEGGLASLLLHVHLKERAQLDPDDVAKKLVRTNENKLMYFTI